MTYPPLNEATEGLRIKWYRTPIEKDELHKLLQRSDLRGWLQVLGVFGYCIVTAALTTYFFYQQMWVLFVIGLFAYGTYACFLGSGCHELTHRTVFKTKWLNEFFLRLTGLINMFNHEEYLMSHTYHHRYTLHPDADREVVLPQSPVMRVAWFVQLFTVNLYSQAPGSDGMYQRLKNTFRTAFGKLPDMDAEGDPIDNDYMIWLGLLYQAHPEERMKAVRFARYILIFHAGVLVVTVISQFWLLPVFITMSRSLANWLKAPTVFLQHAGLRDSVADFRKSTRTVKLDPVTSFMYWRMNFHVEHHMYQWVPCYNLPRLHKTIKHDLPVAKGVWAGFQEVRETWKRQQTDPSYQFDTPIPTSSDSVQQTEPGNQFTTPISTSSDPGPIRVMSK